MENQVVVVNGTPTCRRKGCGNAPAKRGICLPHIDQKATWEAERREREREVQEAEKQRAKNVRLTRAHVKELSAKLGIKIAPVGRQGKTDWMMFRQRAWERDFPGFNAYDALEGKFPPTAFVVPGDWLRKLARKVTV